MLHKMGRIFVSTVLFLSGTGFACPCSSCDCVHTEGTFVSSGVNATDPSENHDCCGSGHQDACEKRYDGADIDFDSSGFCDCSNLITWDGEVLFVETSSQSTLRSLDILVPIFLGAVPSSTSDNISISLSETRVARFDPTLPTYITHHSLLL